MAKQNKDKLNQLHKLIPDGLFVTAAWLEQRGYSRALRKHYVDRGWLNLLTRGVYRRSEGPLAWQQVFVSLSTLLDYPVSIGGLTALGLQGYAHYLFQSGQVVHLYADGKAPTWLSSLPTRERFVVHNRQRLLGGITLPLEHDSLSPAEVSPIVQDTPSAIGLRSESWGEREWPLVMSKPERAILELLDELPKQESFYNVDSVMEGLVNISPASMQALLERTKSVKVKRLFFYFADRHNHSWRQRLDQSRIDLGAGKRMLVKGGKLDPTYQITVPEDL
jgi:hypothetical protein